MPAKPTSRLLTLPLELRLLIYELLWVPLASKIHPKTSTVHSHNVTSSASSSLELLLVCRQIYAEAHQTAYTRHTFALSRCFDTSPLHDLPRSYPYNLVTSLLIPGYRPPYSCPTAYPVRCYTFKELCSLVRRFRNLKSIVVVADTAGSDGIRRSILSRKAHVEFRMRKARRLQDEGFVPSYDITCLKRGCGWRLNVTVGEGVIKTADLLLCVLQDEG
ncbi:hypothetical protein BU26DRAFT_514978 [Trematosphaeria pertusa]|uniref:F-box domain-containing protein n=1 Tax=Trematosphaeria pertusa TaxID=390896 RepID=A0A6A6IYU6_9PLEO|nr:uncharacterized protein BU26DRAFT_514978 [Trematosphaeria pertusa]KAF2255227.1 hypothetical protein BU26DRAFT_514978 [Trematosphaeria pertusa]